MDNKLFDELKQLMGDDPIAGYVHTTMDYSKFKIIKGNRDINNVGRIMRSMEDRYVPTVITVNERFEIIDGQNRFEALKALGKPINYMVIAGLNIKDVRAINQGAKNWTKKDFVFSYAKEGKEEYVLYTEFLKRYPDFSVSLAEKLLRMSASNDDGRRRTKKTYKRIERGMFEIKDFESSCKLADMVMAYKGIDNNRSPIYKRDEFAIAIIKLSRLPEFDNDELVHKVKLYPRSFVPCTSSKEYISILEEIYNYKRRGTKVHFNVD